MDGRERSGKEEMSSARWSVAGARCGAKFLPGLALSPAF